MQVGSCCIVTVSDGDFAAAGPGESAGGQQRRVRNVSDSKPGLKPNKTTDCSGCTREQYHSNITAISTQPVPSM